MEKLQAFWVLVVDVWEKGVFGIDLGRVVVALLILAGFLLLRRLMAKFLVGRLMAFAKRTRFRLDDEIVQALEDPLTLIPVVLGVFIATEYLSLSGRLEVVSVVALGAAQAIPLLVDRYGRTAERRREQREGLRVLVEGQQVFADASYPSPAPDETERNVGAEFHRA